MASALFHKRKSYNVAILGATGAVGQEITQILAERKFPIQSIRFLASPRSKGRPIHFQNKTHIVCEVNDKSFNGIDIVLSSAGGSISKKYAPLAVKQGAVVIDNTSAFRMDPKVPLVIPEINGEAIRKHRGIIANPNCSTIVMLMPLYPLHRVNALKRIYVATYQAASGAGAQAMEELKSQSKEYLAERPVTKNIFPHQIAFNVFSHNSVIDRDGFNEEESKMIRETHKIFGCKSISIAATCIRIPVFRAHSEAIFAEFTKPFTVQRAQQILKRAKGVTVVDKRKQNIFPMPLHASGRDDIFVGRLRQDLHSKKNLSMFVCGDQIRKGAALNAVQIAEKLCGR